MTTGNSTPTPPRAAPRQRRLLYMGAGLAAVVIASVATVVVVTDRSGTASPGEAARVDDAVAGLAYAVPEGWHIAGPDEQLLAGATSTVTAEADPDPDAGDHPPAAAFAGRWDEELPLVAVEVDLDGGLDVVAWQMAHQYQLVVFGPFFEVVTESATATAVDGRPAGTASLRSESGHEPERSPAELVVTVVDTGEAFSFLVTFAAPAAGFEPALSGLHASLELSDAAP